MIQPTFIAGVRIAAFAALATLGGLSQAGELDRIRDAKSITIAHRDASVPLSYVDDQQRPMGYAVEICQRIAEAIKQELKLPSLEVKYLAVTSASRIPTIAEGKASLECGSTTNTAERRKQIDFTIPHFIASSRFIVRADSHIDRVEDLAGRTVVSTKGTTNIKTLERVNNDKILGMKIIAASDHAQAFSMVADGRADAFAMDDILLYGLRATSGNPAKYAVIGKPMTIEPYAIMLPKDDPAFKKVVDQEMRRLIQSGEINQLYDKWFLKPIPPKGITLDLRMPFMLRESFKFPSDKVGDLVIN
ncbi:amino acid ABC transporter substrate-binding protein [Ramlibacter sp. H39-3-26]|uniref:amino acid ABC transporter substrate-binding protein n=1 Tax=Curvibacter soli TaxID=3031331 RepID=UPI0023DB596D|nr:amino acid ABC transporter substrate-binding protein [Ramlibacter sp. H39-3-26]MDF1486367.1 amino acid ABC transporter substrate-binding protein [Ramlibacter sp. H39-3-26]